MYRQKKSLLQIIKETLLIPFIGSKVHSQQLSQMTKTAKKSDVSGRLTLTYINPSPGTTISL